jgi:LysM repeat protein
MAGPVVIGTDPQPTTINGRPAPRELRPGIIRLDPTYGRGVRLVMAGDPDQSWSGGWSQTPLASGAPVTWYGGAEDPGGLTLTAAIDLRIVAEQGLVRSLDALRRMRVAHHGNDQPPKIRIQCAALPLVQRGRWVMQGMQLGALVTRRGHTVRQDVTLTFERYGGLDDVDRVRPGRTRTGKNERRTRTIKTRPGDTLRAIAVRQLGSAGEWKKLRAANDKLKKITPDEPLRAGLRIKIP